MAVYGEGLPTHLMWDGAQTLELGELGALGVIRGGAPGPPYM